MAIITDGLVLFLIAQSFYVCRKIWSIEKNNNELKKGCPLLGNRPGSQAYKPKARTGHVTDIDRQNLRNIIKTLSPP